MSGLVRQKLSPSLCLLREGRAEFLLIAAAALDLRGGAIDDAFPPSVVASSFRKSNFKGVPAAAASLLPAAPASLSLLSSPSLPYQHGTIFVNKLRSRAREGGKLTNICSSTLFTRFGHTLSVSDQSNSKDKHVFSAKCFFTSPPLAIGK